MTPELRQQIFALAAQDVPRRQIAARLGISEGSVRYQLDRPPRPDANGTAELPIPPPSVPTGAADDPLAEARRQLAIEQTNVAHINLRAQRLEAERRMQLLEKAPASDQGAILLVLDALKDLRRDLEQVRAQAVRPAPAPPAPPSELEVLERVQRQTQLLQSIAPSRPPSTAADLELKIATDRLDLEREERMRRLDADLEERRRQLDNERIRSEAIAEQIRSWGPIIGQGVQTWLSRGGNGSGAGRPLIQEPAAVGPRPGLTVLTPERGPGKTIGMIEGPCPGCGALLGIVPEPGRHERCPRCSMAVAVVEGRIWPRLPDDTATHFAS